MMTDDERAGAARQFRERLALLPPPTPERVAEIAALFGSIRLRRARDRARAAAPDTSARPRDTSDQQKILAGSEAPGLSDLTGRG